VPLSPQLIGQSILQLNGLILRLKGLVSAGQRAPELEVDIPQKRSVSLGIPHLPKNPARPIESSPTAGFASPMLSEAFPDVFARLTNVKATLSVWQAFGDERIPLRHDLDDVYLTHPRTILPVPLGPCRNSDSSRANFELTQQETATSHQVNPHFRFDRVATEARRDSHCQGRLRAGPIGVGSVDMKRTY